MKNHKILSWLLSLLLMSFTSTVIAATLSPTTLSLLTNTSGNVTVSSISGSIKLVKSSDSSLFTVSSSLSSPIVVTALNKIGSGRLEVRDARGSRYVTVKVVNPMTVSSSSLNLALNKSATLTLQNVSGTVTLSASPAGIIAYKKSSNSIVVTAKSVGTATLVIKDAFTTKTVVINVGAGASALNGALLASNCYQCHGTYGSGGFDKIAGDSEFYSELQEFLSPTGEHAGGIMAAHLKGYTTEQLQAISTYLSGLNY